MEKWYFTFGCGQQHENCFTVIEGTFASARDKMIKRFGTKWCMQYDEATWIKDDQINKFGIREIK